MTYKTKDDYYDNKGAMAIPWIESPFFPIMVERANLPAQDKAMVKSYNNDGYLIIDLNLDDVYIDKINKDVENLILSNNFVGQEKYEYTDHRRLFQAWKKSDSIRELAMNSKILSVLRLLYNRDPFPFSTINFTSPTSQPLHSDTIHFNSYPSGWMVGVWVAFEDCSVENGTLRVVKGSHKWGEHDYNDANIPHPDSRDNGEKKSYRDYDQFIRRLVGAKGAEETPVNLKKGQAIIWAANLLHGGTPVENDKVSRKSQAIHYFFNGCEKYYTPMFSNPMQGKYAEKWCSEKENIFTYKEK